MENLSNLLKIPNFCRLYRSDHSIDRIFSGFCIVWPAQTPRRGLFVPLLLIPSLALPGTLASLVLSLFSWQIRCSQSISYHSARI